jgi:hypothetical protein
LSGDEQQHQLSKVFGNVMGEMWDYCLTNALLFYRHSCYHCYVWVRLGGEKTLSAHANIEVLVIGSFQSPFEEIIAAASYALGNIAVRNLAQYLPFILN